MIRRSAEASFGKIPTTRVRRLGLGVDPLERVVRPDLRPVALGEAGEGAEVLLGITQHCGDDIEATIELACDLFELRRSNRRSRVLMQRGARELLVRKASKVNVRVTLHSPRRSPCSVWFSSPRPLVLDTSSQRDGASSNVITVSQRTSPPVRQELLCRYASRPRELDGSRKSGPCGDTSFSHRG